MYEINVYVEDPLADYLIEQYPQYEFIDIGGGVIFHVPDNKEGQAFEGVAEQLAKSDEWRTAKPTPKKKVWQRTKMMLVPKLVQRFEKTGICPTCGIEIADFESSGCGIAHLPSKLCPGSELPEE